MPLSYSKNYHIVWMAENFCSFKNKVTPEVIIDDISEIFGVNQEKIFSLDRPAHVVATRQLAMYAVQIITGLNKVSIAKIFKKDHTTVIYALRRVRGYLDTEDQQFCFYWDRYTSQSRIYRQYQ